MHRQGLADAVVVLRSPDRRHEARLAGVPRRGHSDAPLDGHLPAAQVPVEVLPEHARHAVQGHRIDAGVQEAVKMERGEENWCWCGTLLSNYQGFTVQKGEKRR